LRFSDREVGNLLFRVCHDFSASLRAIRSYSELLRREGEAITGSDFAEYVDFILQGVKKADLLRDGLVAYAAALQMEPSAFRKSPLNVLVRSALSKVREEVAASGAEIAVAEMPAVIGDQDRLIELFVQLLRNALAHRGENPPRIQISAERLTGEWRFSMRDNGPGVEGQYLETIFRPLERLHSTKTSGPGIGLATCRAIVEKHGGRIWAESEAGGGLTVYWTLPYR
jgi:light-regulated signal transduction histidine kinase (bacteriophytochrome)